MIGIMTTLFRVETEVLLWVGHARHLSMTRKIGTMLATIVEC